MNPGSWRAKVRNASSVGSQTFPSEIQARLKNLGFYHGPVTGVMDRDTTLGLLVFHKQEKLKCSGEIDEETRAALQTAHEELTSRKTGTE